MSKIIIAGCGYVGKKLAHALNDDNKITTLVRSNENFYLLNQLYETYQIDLDENNTMPDMDTLNSHVIYLIPPSNKFINDNRINHFLASLDTSKPPKQIVLISTTGVYGDCSDNWIDESRAANPDTERGYRRLSVENQLQAFCEKQGIQYIILRVPGIYGPDKLPLQRLLDHKPILKLSESPWSNRIHVDDLIQACICSIDYSGDHHIFNISDNEPSSMSDYFIQVARSRGIEEPPQLSMNECKKLFSDNMMSYLRESKKIDNSLMTRELGVNLQYPTLKEGLLPNQ